MFKKRIAKESNSSEKRVRARDLRLYAENGRSVQDPMNSILTKDRTTSNPPNEL